MATAAPSASVLAVVPASATAAAAPRGHAVLPLTHVKGAERDGLLVDLKSRKVVQFLSGSRETARFGHILNAFASLGGRKGAFDANIQFDGERNPRQVELKPYSKNNQSGWLFWVDEPPSDERLVALMPLWTPSPQTTAPATAAAGPPTLEAMVMALSSDEAAAPAMPPLSPMAAPLPSPSAPPPPEAMTPPAPPAQMQTPAIASVSVESYMEKREQLAAERSLLRTLADSDVLTKKEASETAARKAAAAKAEHEKAVAELAEAEAKRRRVEELPQ